jgi:glucuronoarabinoxylan endo-1,4-beta-xylanase
MSIKYFGIYLFLVVCLVVSPAYGATGTVKYNTVYQQLDGWGGAIYNDTYKLTHHSKKEEIYDLLFKDLHLDILRVRNMYGYPETHSDEGMLARELPNAAEIIAEAREPQRSPNIKILLTPWSPAAHVKSNNNIFGGTLAKDIYGNYVYDDYAQWWYDSLLAWEANGVVADYISIQNEPDQITSYDSCRLDPTEGTTYAGYDKAYEAVWNKLNVEMGASMPKMWASDHSGYGTSHINALVSRVGSEKVDGFNFHLYGAGSYDNPDGMIPGMINFYNTYGYKPLNMTEYVRLNTTPNFDMAWRFAWHIYNCLYYLHTTSYFNWTLFRGYSPTSGGIVTMDTQDTYIIRPQYWFLKAYSYFSGKDWYVLGTSASGTDAANLRISAFKNPDNDELTVVILNIATTSTDVNLILSGFAPDSPDSSEVYQSSADANWVYLGTYEPLMTLPSRSITTIALSGAAIPDTAPPTPDPMTWDVPPTASGATSITMTATTATDDTDPVLYYFECTTDGNKSSGWQTDATYEATGLERSTEYSFRVKARDSASTPHETDWSSTMSATTLEASVDIIGSWVSGLTHAVEPGTGRGLVFFAHAENTANAAFGPTSVTYGGQPMTKITDVNVSTSGGGVCVGAFFLNEAGIAAATSDSFDVTWSTPLSRTGYGSVFLEGVHQTNPVGDRAVNSITSGTTITTSSLFTGEGDMVIAASTCSSTGSYTMNNDFVTAQELSISSADAVNGYKGYKQAAGGMETPSVTHSNSNSRKVLLGFVVKVNHPPVADAGDNQSVAVSDLVTLDGSGSSDADGDQLTYQWTFTSVPAGSTAVLNDADTVSPSFVPDIPGIFEVSLIVNDGTLFSRPDIVTVSAVTQQTWAIQMAQHIMDTINNLDDSVFNNPNNKKALTNKLNAVINQLEAGNYDGAINKLENDLLAKTDGCVETGHPDKNDWLLDCDTQAAIYPLIVELIEYLQNM